jgi:ribosomal protein L7/L12
MSCKHFVMLDKTNIVAGGYPKTEKRDWQIPEDAIQMVADYDLDTNKVSLIKAIRDVTGLGLVDSKDLADTLCTLAAMRVKHKTITEPFGECARLLNHANNR